jgi:hypothetical protein
MSFCLAYCEDLGEIRFCSASLHCVCDPTICARKISRSCKTYRTRRRTSQCTESIPMTAIPFRQLTLSLCDGDCQRQKRVDRELLTKEPLSLLFVAYPMTVPVCF